MVHSGDLWPKNIEMHLNIDEHIHTEKNTNEGQSNNLARKNRQIITKQKIWPKTNYPFHKNTNQDQNLCQYEKDDKKQKI